MTVIVSAPAAENPPGGAGGRYRRLASALSLMMALFIPSICESSDTQVVQPGKGWRYRVVVNKLPEVDDLAVGSDGSVYATQELGEGKGQVVRVRNRRVDVIIGGMEQPGGVLANGRYLYVTEHVGEGRVVKINLKDGRRKVYEGLRHPQRIAALNGGEVVVTEDLVHGRLTRISASGVTEVIASGFSSIEGLSVARDGTFVIGESGTGRVLAFKDGELNVMVDDLEAIGQVVCSSDDAIWITEDSTSGRLLRLKEGVLETVLTGLSNPQGIAVAETGAVFVAERGRNRILVVEPKP